MPASAKLLELIAPTSQSLSAVSDEVTPDELKGSYIQAVIDRMFEMAAGKGHTKQDTRQMVGLAAPQLGVNKRIILIDLTADGSNKEQHLQALINPKITKRSKETMPGREGCWSAGNICGNVERSKTVTLKALDRDSKPITLELEDFVARIAQHETDHLDGIRFPDRIPADQPDKLHWVEPVQFQDYREQWAIWPIKCTRERWTRLKAGINL